ncbi:SgrR family transcriptional activator [Tatumella ptyseos ATCC 33301]|uniref:SgrR family transcriptional activator n=1 Tax=Tatumella ptyseos ATCC 33301 TaxID=1005995 RepID=A0A085JCT1_9GAMM|nr:SgrR family transcriptional regulator [Tatumella ptyseos]KFD18277.1 SgrR family transcriptional activator [Tatumella ptyseos ATCC 33301]
MTVQRLEQHYRRLLAFYPQREVTLTLGELADKICCSKRHMRGVLLRMQQAGWLSWQPGVGRGHQSVLTLHYSETQLLFRKAEQLLDEGDIRSAVTLLGDQQQLVAGLLRQKLGYQVREDYQSLRIPYYRTMPNLAPGTPLRRSEIHLVKQIFSGLTRVNDQTGLAEADLAHFWSQRDYRDWTFHLRPAVRFHDGRELTSDDVVTSLARLVSQPLFSHIARVHARGRLTVEITLSQPDACLPLLLTDSAALILPADFASRPDFATLPVGTGPYRVEENNRLHLRMRAFDHYFGLRGLLDEIEVIVWPPALKQAAEASQGKGDVRGQPSAWLSSSLSDIEYISGQAVSLTGHPGEDSGDMFPEKGGYFLLCDSRSPHWQQSPARRWIREILNPYALIQRFIPAIRPLWIPAASLMPDWLHAMSEGEAIRPASLPVGGAGNILRLAFHRQHPEFEMLAREMQFLLKQQGIILQLMEQDYEEWANGEGNVDLWLGTVNFPVPEVWNAGAWLLSLPLLRHSVSGGDAERFARWQHAWRAGSLQGKQLTQQVIHDGWLQPLFHHWMRLKSPGQAQGIRLNNLGWFDFTRAWMAPAAGPGTEKEEQ